MNIFGPEFTPYHDKVTKHKKQPSANMVAAMEPADDTVDNLMLLSQNVQSLIDKRMNTLRQVDITPEKI